MFEYTSIVCFILSTCLFAGQIIAQERGRVRDFGIEPGVLRPGSANAITDVEGVLVGHTTLVKGDTIRTGVTAILPHAGDMFQQKVPAAIYVGNGFGKLMGITQVNELGSIETPIILTNTLSVPTAANAVIQYMLKRDEQGIIRSVNPVIGEINDGHLNDIRGMHVEEEHIFQAIDDAGTDVSEGNVGAGTGTIAFGWKGGIGTSSRKLPAGLGGYTIGVLVQANFGGVLTIEGVSIGEKLNKYPYQQALKEGDGSCMIIIATDAPVDHRNLKRMASRAMLGLARTGGYASNGSGDYVIAFCTAEGNRISYDSNRVVTRSVLSDQAMSPLFLATVEATEEAILNAIFMAEDAGDIKALPIDKVLELLKTD